MMASTSISRAALASLALLLAIWLPARAMAQNGTAAPPGSYLSSCKEISYIKNEIVAKCETGKVYNDGAFDTGTEVRNYERTAIKVDHCNKSGDISNYYGDLVCTSTLPTDVAPGGSYLQSCRSPHVLDGLLIVRCKDEYRNSYLNLAQCDTSKPVANISSQLICAPKPTKVPAAKPVAQAGPAAWTPTATQAKMMAAGCDLFLGRANDFLCKNEAGFAQCKAMINGGDVKACHAAGQLTTDCQPFLGRANEYLCVSETAYQQCMSFQAEGKLKACHAKGH
jgi:hypothetical protein